MALAGDLIDEARDYHPSFTRERFPPRMLLRRLQRAEHDLFVLVAGLEPELLAKEEAFGWEEIRTALENRTPLELPPYIQITSARAFYEPVSGIRESLPVRLLETSQSLSRVAPFPSATPVAPGLLLTDLRDAGARRSGWEEIGNIQVRYVPVPPPLQDLRSPLSAPDFMDDALVGDLVTFMALRGGVEDMDLRSAAARAREALITQLSVHGQATTWHVEPAWP